MQGESKISSVYLVLDYLQNPRTGISSPLSISATLAISAAVLSSLFSAGCYVSLLVPVTREIFLVKSIFGGKLECCSLKWRKCCKTNDKAWVLSPRLRLVAKLEALHEFCGHPLHGYIKVLRHNTMLIEQLAKAQSTQLSDLAWERQGECPWLSCRRENSS